ncbi:MAG: MbtH family NRPS accessory protein [Piscinibacter sp.]|nr:MbtH family NRPS accessory protein [Piscinibacter sp.]
MGTSSRAASPAQYGIISNGDGQYGTWPTNRRLPNGWRYTGMTGTQSELLLVLRTQYVETLPAPLIAQGPGSR